MINAKLLSNGQIEIRQEQLVSLCFRHLMTQTMDRDPFTGEYRDVIYCGITEWVSVLEPTISVGWDWIVKHNSWHYRVRKLGDYRTNLLVVDPEGCENSKNQSEVILDKLFEEHEWTKFIERELERNLPDAKDLPGNKGRIPKTPRR